MLADRSANPIALTIFGVVANSDIPSLNKLGRRGRILAKASQHPIRNILLGIAGGAFGGLRMSGWNPIGGVVGGLPPGQSIAPFNGRIDELTLYARALTQSEIQGIFNADGRGKCPSNHPPVVHDMIAATAQNLPMTIQGDKFVLLASDPDNDPLSLMSVSATSTNGGSVVLNSGQVTYTPTANYMGPDRFTFTISDNHGGIASAAVLLNVRSANEISGNMLPPVAVSNGYRVSFLGIPGRTYTLQRATNVHGPWLSIGAIPASPSGLGSFTDTNPPPVSAFYRTIYP